MSPSPVPANKIPVLMVGLPADHPSLVGVKPAHEIEAGFRMVEAQFKNSPYALSMHLFGPEDTGGRDAYAAVLRSRPWKGIVIGFGVRAVKEHSDFFEDLVNIAKRNCPEAAFCFNAGLPGTLKSVERNVPVDGGTGKAEAETRKRKRMRFSWRGPMVRR